MKKFFIIALLSVLLSVQAESDYKYIPEMEAKALAERIGGRVLHFSDTKSMLPGITKDTVGVGIVWEGEYKVGDIVVLRTDDKFISHRIIEEKAGLFLLKGDSARLDDGWFSPDYFWWKVVVLFSP